MSMIHPAVRERAVKRFEDKFWEFLSLYFECDAPLYEEWRNCEQESVAILRECRILYDKVREAKKAKPKPTAPKCVLTPQAMPSIGELPTIESSFALGQSDGFSTIDDMDRLQGMAEKGLALEDKAEEIDQKRSAIAQFSHMAQMIKYEEPIESLGDETAKKFLDFEVDDPYETCFAYLCLIEAGSDIPWAYNAALAVLMAAARKLPWNAFAIEQQEELESEFENEDEDDEDCLETLLERADVDVEEGETVAPLDWNERKAALYRLNYLSRPLYAPLESPSPNWKMNIPQLIYGLTGMVMPRVVSDCADMSEEFVAAGMEEGVAKGLELYLQLALDMQTQSKDWRSAASASSFPFLEKFFALEDISESDNEDNPENLRAKLKQLKEENADIREALYRAQREIETVRENTAQVEAQAASERAELARLRELVYTQANATEISEPEVEKAVADQFPYVTKKRIVVFGGHETWLKAIRPLLPNVTFVNREQHPNVDMVKAADVVWIQANALSHRIFYKVINVVRANQVPIRYFGYASAMKCAIQVLEDDA